MKISKTKQYDMFVFRDDNREKINQSHVKRLADSIKSNNLLEYAPILVNEKMEVIDGQHRLIAAKSLGIEVYYKKQEGLKAEDIITLNMSQKWGYQDYLNFYCKNGYPEYVKLKEFMQKYKVQVRVALNITMKGHGEECFIKFKKGEYIYTIEDVQQELDLCWETIDYIKKINGASQSIYTTSAKFWSALLQMVRHADFNPEKWRENLKRMVDRITVKVSKRDYLNTFLDIHNWKNRVKMEIDDE